MTDDSEHTKPIDPVDGLKGYVSENIGVVKSVSFANPTWTQPSVYTSLPSSIAPMKVLSDSELRLKALELALAYSSTFNWEPSQVVAKAQEFFDFLAKDPDSDKEAGWDD